jgi:putative ABC transport system permease protein
MIGTFLNLVGAVRTLALAISFVALAISALAILNTMLTAVLERTGEIGMMRALGASRSQVFGMMTLESAFLMLAGTAGGVLLAMLAGGGVEQVARQLVPMAESSTLLAITRDICLQCFALCGGIGLVAGLYPAFQASRLRPVEALRTE